MAQCGKLPADAPAASLVGVGGSSCFGRIGDTKAEEPPIPPAEAFFTTSATREVLRDVTLQLATFGENTMDGLAAEAAGDEPAGAAKTWNESKLDNRDR